MKTMITTLAIALAVLASEQSFATETSVTKAGPDWTIAPSVGVTSFQLKTDALGDLDSKAGMSVGAAVFKQTGITDLDFETGLQYIQAGGKNGNILASYEVNLDYLAIPLGIRWKALSYGADGKNFLYLRTGATAAVLMSAKEKASLWGVSQDGDIKDQVNTLDIMAVAGLGGSYSLGNDQHILYELNYLRGTQKVMKEGDSHSEGYALNVMYSIPL